MNNNIQQEESNRGAKGGRYILTPLYDKTLFEPRNVLTLSKPFVSTTGALCDVKSSCE